MQPLPGSAFLFVHRNTTIWIPFLITTTSLPPTVRSQYTLWLLIELAGHVFAFLTLLLNIFLMLKVNAFHLNIKILSFYGVGFMSALNLITRLVLMLIECEYFIMEESSEFLLPLILVKLTIWVGIYNCVTYTTIERYAALKYSSDYETNKRVSISIIIMIVNSMVSAPVAYLLVFNKMDGAVYMLAIFFLSNASCVAFSRIALWNKEEDKELSSFHCKYSVSRRWQVKDNIRMAKDIRIIIYGCAAQISFNLPIFFIPPLLFEHDPQWMSLLELNKAIFQLVCAYGFGIAHLFCALSVTRHLEYVKSIFWKEDVCPKISPVPVDGQTTHDHFESLKIWWDKEADKSFVEM